MNGEVYSNPPSFVGTVPFVVNRIRSSPEPGLSAPVNVTVTGPR